MEIFEKLGIDSTLFYQLVLFSISYLALSRLLFKPYLGAYHKRIESTVGHQEVAEKLNEKTKELHGQYESRARDINARAQAHFERAHKEAVEHQTTTIEKARKQSDELIQKVRQEIVVETKRAREELKKLIPGLSEDIQKKILSRDI